MVKKNSEVHTDDDALAKLSDLTAAPEFKNYEEENLSLPPYLVIEVGKSFAARVIDLDTRDSSFARYILEAMAPIDCQTGARDEAEGVHVKVGEYFTCSTYAGLPLDRYIGCRVVVKCVGTRKTNQPQPMYVFKMAMHPEDKKMVMADRKALAQQKMHAFRESQKNTRALPAQGETVGGTA